MRYWITRVYPDVGVDYVEARAQYAYCTLDEELARQRCRLLRQVKEADGEFSGELEFFTGVVWLLEELPPSLQSNPDFEVEVDDAGAVELQGPLEESELDPLTVRSEYDRVVVTGFMAPGQFDVYWRCSERYGVPCVTAPVTLDAEGEARS